MSNTDDHWFLTGVGGAVTGREFVLVGEDIRLGRTPENDIVIPERNASRHHATIYWRDGMFWVRDAGSKNGTFVNEEKIQDAPLQENDMLRISDCRFRMGTEILEEEIESESGILEEGSFPASSPKILNLLGRLKQLGRGRLLLYGVAAFVLLLGIVVSQKPKKAPPPPTKTQKRYQLPPAATYTKKASDDEVLMWKTRAERAIHVEDFQTAVRLFRDLVAARPQNAHYEHRRKQIEARLSKSIAQYYENGAREFEKLYYDRAIREWQKVVALAADFDPDMVKKTKQKIKEAEQKLRERR